MTINELDKWAWDIEQDEKNGVFISQQIKKQYSKICEIRDRLHEQHVKSIKELNRFSNGIIHCPIPRSCYERAFEKQ